MGFTKSDGSWYNKEKKQQRLDFTSEFPVVFLQNSEIKKKKNENQLKQQNFSATSIKTTAS